LGRAKRPGAFFELHLDCIPELRLDNREIIAAHLASPEDLHGIALTGEVAAYLGRDLHVLI
jgi:8-oxo-dGTP diphosphatase